MTCNDLLVDLRHGTSARENMPHKSLLCCWRSHSCVFVITWVGYEFVEPTHMFSPLVKGDRH